MIARFLVALALAGGLFAATVTSASSAPRTIEVSFLRGGKLVGVERVLPRGARPAKFALRQLLLGPTREERTGGLRSAIHEGARIRSLRSTEDTWLVSFSRSLFRPATARTTWFRLAQIAATLSSLDRQHRYVAVSAEGRLATVLRLHTRVGPWRAEAGEKGYAYSVRGVQLRMFQLGYLSPAQVTGALDYATTQALLAFQGWEGLARTGSVTEQVQVALVRVQRPRPRYRGGRRHVEIHRDRGVVLLVERGVVERAVHTSTGAGGATPAGSFRVYRQEILSWSVPFQVWMPFASYFVGGIAMHEYSHVPAYAASHGCVRLPAGDARRVFRFAEVGTPVHVF
jgi:L,D-transpeptidase catalytic domain/Sporulation and spore germination/Putative peptidoglycan binding domain